MISLTRFTEVPVVIIIVFTIDFNHFCLPASVTTAQENMCYGWYTIDDSSLDLEFIFWAQHIGIIFSEPKTATALALLRHSQFMMSISVIPIFSPVTAVVNLTFTIRFGSNSMDKGISPEVCSKPKLHRRSYHDPNFSVLLLLWYKHYVSAAVIDKVFCARE